MPRLWLDTSVFTDAVQNHRDSEACRQLLRAIAEGRLTAVLDPVVLCEVAYMLVKPQFVPAGQPPRKPAQVAEHLLSVCAWPGLTVLERDTVLGALQAWSEGQADDLVDCYLYLRAKTAGEDVCTINRRHFPHSIHPAESLGEEAPPRRSRRRRAGRGRAQPGDGDVTLT